MAKYRVPTVVKARGMQCWIVEADSPEAAVEKFKRCGGDSFDSEEIEITDVDDPELDAIEEFTDEDDEDDEETPIEQLRKIDVLLVNIAKQHPSDSYQRGFLEGRGFELTRGMESHPKNWERSCGCDECMDY